MVRPQELIEGVLYTLQQSDSLSSSVNFIGYEPDIDSEPIKLPMIEVSPGIQENISEMNTDFIGMETDDSGREVAEIYESLYTLEINVAIWTAHGSKFSPREISNTVRDELYSHDTSGPGKPLRNSDDSSIDEVWRFSLQEGEQTDNLGTSPTLRRWQQSILVSASEQYVTQPDEDPVESIDFNDTTTETVTETNTEITVSSGDTK